MSVFDDDGDDFSGSGFDAGDMNDDYLFNGSGDPSKPDPAVSATKFMGGGGRKPPSEKQIEFAKKIANTIGESLPDGYDSDWKVTADFIDRNKETFTKMSPQRESSPPSEKQLNFAKMIADKIGKTLPDNVDADWRVTKRFIEDNKAKWEKQAKSKDAGAKDKGTAPQKTGYKSGSKK